MLNIDESTTNGAINQEKIAVGVHMILEAIGEDPDREADLLMEHLDAHGAAVVVEAYQMFRINFRV